MFFQVGEVVQVRVGVGSCWVGIGSGGVGCWFRWC